MESYKKFLITAASLLLRKETFMGIWFGTCLIAVVYYPLEDAIYYLCFTILVVPLADELKIWIDRKYAGYIYNFNKSFLSAWKYLWLTVLAAEFAYSFLH